jgi:pimeloyl-ACP methyl ester carboxylesterase
MKLVLSLLLTVVFCYLMLVALLAAFQRHMLYLPSRVSMAQMEQPALRAWPPGQTLRGLVAEPAGTVRATAIVFHGNAGHAGQRGFYASALVPEGVRVILAEYPGYGPRGGTPSETSLVDDAVQTIALARRLHGQAPVLIGESLGAGVAAAAAARRRGDVTGLLLITPWDALANVGAHHYRWIPVRRLLRDRYDNVAHLRSITVPVVVAVAERDSIVPARFGRALYDSLAGPRRLLVVAGADHNDWTGRVDADWWRGAIGFALGR